MNKQNTVDSKVLAILKECPETRYDDMQLILCYYNRYSYLRVGDLPLEDIVNNYTNAFIATVAMSGQFGKQGLHSLPCSANSFKARQAVSFVVIDYIFKR